MTKQKSLTQRIEQGVFKMGRGVARLSYPTSWEKLEIDENRSLWASYTPEYRPGSTLSHNTTADLAIIGGGFTGVSTAYHFSRRYPEKRVVLLEAKSLANGASGRNGGMMLNWIYGMRNMSPELTARMYQATNKTIDEIEAIIARHNLKVSYRRDGCMFVYTKLDGAEAAKEEADYLNGLNIPIKFLDGKTARECINLNGIHGALVDPNEGQLNGAQYVRSLRPVLQEQGVGIYENTPVMKVDEGSTIILTTPNGTVRAKAIVLAMNGYTGKLGYFRKAYFPLHSHVYATAPLAQEAVDGLGWQETAGFSDDLNRLSYGTLTREGHIVFGGGSNRSYEYLFNNRTVFPGSPESAMTGFKAMEKTMASYLPGTAQLPIAHRWTGTLAITLRRNCSMGVRGEHKNVYYSLGYSGHGVVAANLAGRVLTDLYSNNMDEWQGMPFINADFSPIPLEPFRWMGYQAMVRLTGRSPRESFR